MKNFYVDFHTHTKRSDGQLSPEELVIAAKNAGIGVLAITDHNMLCDELGDLQLKHPDIKLIDGVEISTMYGETEIHVIGLDVDKNNQYLRDTLALNTDDRRPYINAILQKLRELGIDLGTYDDICSLTPDSIRIGRMHIAKAMKHRGFVESVDEAFDRYIGAFGQRLAYVENPHRYITIEKAVDAILASGGIPVLCHLYYYSLTEEESEALVAKFKALGGEKAALEVAYSRYDEATRKKLANLAKKYNLRSSAASDFHGFEERVSLDNHFPYEYYESLFGTEKHT
ncbi:MAG: PHP domain-containing protein [Ruminococcaceae bacterium]|nr:PHP domain-containing protein [Oscillospiraceae bacterium]